jgi:serine/threonine protein kinase
VEPPDTSDTSPPDPAGITGRLIIGRFRVERLLGRAAAAAKSCSPRTRSCIAASRSSGSAPTRAGTPRDAPPCLREARRASQINDRRIAAIYDVLELDDDVLIVMEFVEGTTLREHMTGRSRSRSSGHSPPNASKPWPPRMPTA